MAASGLTRFVVGLQLVLALVVAGLAWPLSAPAPALAIVAGTVALVAASSAVAASRGSAIAGSVTVIVAPALAFAAGDPAWRSVLAPAALVLPGLLALELAWVSGRGVGAALAVLVAAVGSYAAHVAFVDPFLVVECGRLCHHNPLVVEHRPSVADGSHVVLAVALIGFVIASRGTSATRWPLRRDATWAVSAGIVAVACTRWARLVETVRWPASGLVVATVAIVMAIAADGVRRDVHVIAVRRRISAASRALGTGPGRGLDHLLRDALGDPSLTIEYPLHDGRMVDASGAEHPPPTGGHGRTTLTRRGQQVAVLTGSSNRTVVSSLTPHLIVAIENEGLLVRTRAALDDLRRSRERLVASADETRHQLERDLHDGAQQRLLAVTMALAEHDDGTVPERAEALADASEALDRLRHLARGLYPVSLDRLGLGAALRSYLDEAPVAVDLCVHGVERPLGGQLDRVVYRVVRTFVDGAAAAGAGSVSVCVERVAATVRASLAHDGTHAVDDVDIVDRVGAVGGVWTAAEQLGRHVGVLEVPCG